MKKTVITFSLVIFTLLTLQSCLVAKDYEQAELSELRIDDSKFRTDNIQQDSLSLADVSWKNLFTDPNLTQLIELGLEKNIDIRVALQQIIRPRLILNKEKQDIIQHFLPTQHTPIKNCLKTVGLALHLVVR